MTLSSVLDCLWGAMVVVVMIAGCIVIARAMHGAANMVHTPSVRVVLPSGEYVDLYGPGRFEALADLENKET